MLREPKALCAVSDMLRSIMPFIHTVQAWLGQRSALDQNSTYRPDGMKVRHWAHILGHTCIFDTSFAQLASRIQRQTLHSLHDRPFRGASEFVPNHGLLSLVRTL